MDGKQLYEIYTSYTGEAGVAMDTWENLEDYDRMAWNQTAAWVSRSR